ncbi:hypothetical protein Q5P01_009654 [Channa striata]|uniref:Hexosyltransferase n=1 Tax=Channa striata TaxID=64152 RepID=A0AA88SSG6_CHASR|nr:hypothetical protein Q5P01_009654 [Channa striata]
MKRLSCVVAMIVLTTVFTILYMTLNLDVASGFKPGPNDLQKQRGMRVQITEAKPEPFVSDGFRQVIPQNGAYWNRLVHSALRELDQGENQFRNDFVQVMNCRSPPVLLDQPNKCIASEEGEEVRTILLLAIKSTPGNFERRQAVRETWGSEVFQSGVQVRTVFLLGTTPQDHPNLSALLSFESDYHGDLLQWDFQESLLNLTLKMNMFLEWTLKRCPQVSYVFSGDDDVFMNTPALLTYLTSQEASSRGPHLYVGQIIRNGSPIRDPYNKYYIPLSFYDGPYPAYAGGGGYLFSGALLGPLHSLLNVIPFYPIDDVYAGMCFNALGVSPEAHPGFRTFDVKDQDRENLCVHKDLILIHRRSPSQITKLWKGIHNPLLTC